MASALSIANCTPFSAPSPLFRGAKLRSSAPRSNLATANKISLTPREVEKIRIHFQPHEARQQVAHSMPPEKVEIFKSLEEWAEKNILIHLKPVEKSWQPQDFLPDPSSEGFIDQLIELRERCHELPDDYLVCLVGDMITEEALPTYQSQMNSYDGVRDETGASLTSWATWTRMWTAEENRHGDLLHKYLYLSGRVDMRQIEKTIQYLIGVGMYPGTENSPYLGFMYTSFQERATFISHGNTARFAKGYGDLKLAQICGIIAADEKRHETAYTKIVEKLFEIDPDTTMLAFEDLMRKKVIMPAHLMYDGQDVNLFDHFSCVAQRLGVYTAGDYADILEFLVERWNVKEIGGLSGKGRKAQDYVCKLAPRIRKVEERAQEKAKQDEDDKVSTVPVLFKEHVVGQYSVPEPVEVPEKSVHEGSSRIDLVEKIEENGNLENIPTTISIDCRYQEMTDNDAEWTAQKSRKKMKDKARSKLIDDTGVLVPENMVEKSESCMDIVAANDIIRKDIGSIGIRAKSSAVSLAVDETSIIPTAEFGLPRMVLCLAHDGEIAWDVKWQPLTDKDHRNQHRLGFLAVLLGDGSMQVWEVPVPSAVNFLFTSSYARGGLDPRFVKLDPVFKCSKLQSGGRQSIPLTLEWSTSAPHDLLLAGCHDGMVAVWKFSPKASSSQDARPLICFIADTLAIRTLAWAPSDGDSESKNVFVTGGHGGSLRFWDLRDHFRPLWDLHLSRGIILSLDWLHEPRCIILSMDDGTLRLLSLTKAALDTPVTGRSFCGTQFQGLQSYYCSSFSIWNVQVSRLTGLVAYCSVDGSALHFQLTQKAVDKDKMRHRTPHYICGAFVEEGSKAFKVISPSTLTPVRMKKSLNEWSDTPRSIRGFLSESNQAIRANIQAADNKYMRSSSMELAVVSDADTITPSKSKITKKSKKTTSGKHSTADVTEDMEDLPLVPSVNAGRCSSGVEGLRDMTSPIEKYPSKLVAVHRVRWNFNKGSERWLCYSGAAGIVRCQEITSVFSA